MCCSTSGNQDKLPNGLQETLRIPLWVRSLLIPNFSNPMGKTIRHSPSWPTTKAKHLWYCIQRRNSAQPRFAMMSLGRKGPRTGHFQNKKQLKLISHPNDYKVCLFLKKQTIPKDQKLQSGSKFTSLKNISFLSPLKLWRFPHHPALNPLHVFRVNKGFPSLLKKIKT